VLTNLFLDGRCLIPALLPCLDRLLCSLSLAQSGNWWLFLRGKSGWCVKLNTASPSTSTFTPQFSFLCHPCYIPEFITPIHDFLTSALVGGEWSASPLGRFTTGEKAPGTNWRGGWVSPRDGLDYMEKWKFLTTPGLELRPLGRPPHSQSLYRLSCPASITLTVFQKK
jgi:hypothetical protein